MNKRDQIFAAAVRLFNENGFDRTPTSQIASEAGVATGTLFHYFRTKEELINSLYLRCKDSMISRALEGTAHEKTYRSRIKRMYMNLLHWGVENREEFDFFQQYSNSPYIREMTRQEGRNKFHALVGVLLEGIEKEIIKNVDVEYLVTIVTSLLSANIEYYIANPHMMGNEAFLEKSFGFIWNSIKN